MARRPKENAQHELKAMGEIHAHLAALDEAAVRRVLSWVTDHLGLSTAAVVAAVAAPAPTGGRGDQDGLAAFMESKRPGTNAERIACLAHFLTRRVGQSKFRTRDLSRLNDGAGLAKFTNTAMAVKNAREKGWVSINAGFIALTNVGAQLVDALPNRTAALIKTRSAAKAPRGRPKG